MIVGKAQQLTYKEQLEKVDEMVGKLTRLPVVSLDQYRGINNLRETLVDRIAKQKKGEI